MKREVIIACDFKCKEELFSFLSPFSTMPFLKIGMELFYKEGPELIKQLKQMGCKIFLDLKLHDIPNTVEKAMKNIAELEVELTNVHAAGGIEMMKAAKRGLDSIPAGKHTKLIAVTQLTSISQETLEKELCISLSLQEVVYQYASNAKSAGLDGVVCSALEVPLLKDLQIITVTPGIRFAENSSHDQKRVATPKDARMLGSTYIVVGRSITSADDPVAAYERCVKEFC